MVRLSPGTVSKSASSDHGRRNRCTKDNECSSLTFRTRREVSRKITFADLRGHSHLARGMSKENVPERDAQWKGFVVSKVRHSKGNDFIYD